MVKGCVAQIKRFKHPEVNHRIVVADQSTVAIYEDLVDTYKNAADVEILRLPKVDAGYPIDIGARTAKGEYFCSLDCDAFPIHPCWLYLPIRLMEKYNLGLVGNTTGLHYSYMDKTWQPKPWTRFFELNNYFRVSKTSLAKKVSEEAGFMRPAVHAQVGFKPAAKGWEGYADTGVLANWYIDDQRLGTKLSLKINKFLGHTKRWGIYGMVIDDLVFHLVFGFGEDWVGDQDGLLGKEYLELKASMKARGITHELLMELVAKCRAQGGPRLMTYWKDSSLMWDNAPKDVDEFVEKVKGGME
jgi:hypothetical protein